MIRPYITNCRFPDCYAYIFISVFTLVGANLLLDAQVGLLTFLQIIVISILFAAYAFASNNHFDRLADRHNPAKIARNPVAGGQLSSAQSIAQNIFLAAVMVILSALWFIRLVPILILLLINMTLYNAMFKSRPLLDLISHAIGTASFVIVPLFIIGLPMDLLFLTAVVVLAGSNMAELHNQMQDYRADRAAKVRTTTTRYGLRFAKAVYLFSSAVVALSIFFFYTIFPRWYVLLFLAIPATGLAIFMSPRLDKYNTKIILAIIFLLLLTMLLG